MGVASDTARRVSLKTDRKRPSIGRPGHRAAILASHMAARKGATSTVDVEAVRREIPGVDGRAYLNTGGLGLMPQVARQEIRSHYDRLGPAIDPTNWYRECVSRAGDLRERIAGFVGAEADEIALKTSVVDGFGSVLWG